MKSVFSSFFVVVFLFLFLLAPFSFPETGLFSVCSADSPAVVINEIAWMGTSISPNDEWIELFNNSDQSIDLTDWTLIAIDGTPSIKIAAALGPNTIIPAAGFFVLERTDDTTLPNITADQIYTGALSNTGEKIELKDASGQLIDSTFSWTDKGPGKAAPEYATMERKSSALPGNDLSSWQTSASQGGTPKAQNSLGAPAQMDEEQPDEQSSETPDETASSTSASSPTSNNSTTNQPPEANAGPDIIALANQDITFDATQSSDPDGDTLTYLWNFGDGTTSDKPTVSHFYQYPGTYIVVLEAGDGQNTSSDQAVITIYSNSILISEFLPAPAGADGDNEWIELYNDSDRVADLSGWQVDDAEGGSKPLALPKNTLLAGHQYLVLQRPTTKIALNNDTDSVRLIYPTGQVAQEVQYAKTKEDQSVSLAATGQYVWNSSPTPGGPNFISTGQQETSNQILADITQPEENAESIKNIIPQEAASAVTQETQAVNSSASAPLKEISSSPSNKKSGPTNNQSASLTETIKSSPATTILLMIVFGVLAGLGLIKIRRKRER